MDETFTILPDGLENIILSKSYNELNSAEVELIHEHIANEAEYIDIRSTLRAVGMNKATTPAVTPSSELKASLMKKFNPGVAPALPFFKNPFFLGGIVAAGIALIVILNMGGTEEEVINPPVTNETIVETESVEESTMTEKESEEIVVTSAEETPDNPDENEPITELNSETTVEVDMMEESVLNPVSTDSVRNSNPVQFEPIDTNLNFFNTQGNFNRVTTHGFQQMRSTTNGMTPDFMIERSKNVKDDTILFKLLHTTQND